MLIFLKFELISSLTSLIEITHHIPSGEGRN